MRLLASGWLLFTSACLAQDEYALLFQPQVVSALRYLTSAAHAPASVDVITAEDIQRFGYRTLAETVASVPGFQATYDRSYGHLQVRGFSLPGDYSGRILILIDGHRLNENLQDYAGLNSDFPLAMQDIDHIEVVRGPASSLYGSNALLAVIHVFTKHPEATQLKLQSQAGSFGSFQGYLGASAVLEETGAYLSSTLWRRRPPRAALPGAWPGARTRQPRRPPSVRGADWQRLESVRGVHGAHQGAA